MTDKTAAPAPLVPVAPAGPVVIAAPAVFPRIEPAPVKMTPGQVTSLLAVFAGNVTLPPAVAGDLTKLRGINLNINGKGEGMLKISYVAG